MERNIITKNNFFELWETLNDATEWILRYYNSFDHSKVLENPTYKIDVTQKAPETGSNFNDILKKFDGQIKSGINFWTHPGFMGYFNSTTTPVGIAGDLLSTVINANCMTYKSCPAGTELEKLTLNWVKELLGIDSDFFGVMYEGGSSSNFHALIAARAKVFGSQFKTLGFSALTSHKPYTVYFSDQTHSSIQKGLTILGIGNTHHRIIPANKSFQIDLGKLEAQIQADIQSGNQPFCVVASIGTTSCTAVDDIKSIAKICRERNIWLHIDASHGGALAMLEEKQNLFEGWNEANSITVNPHKWMFVPLDLSILYLKQPELLKESFSIEAEYLKNLSGSDDLNYMDYGISLGRRFRALKLWFTIKYLGKSGYQSILRNHLIWAKWLYQQIDKHPDLELNAPLPMSTVCFSIRETSTLEAKNIQTHQLLEKINADGHYFLTHTKLNGVLVIRVVISSYTVRFSTIEKLWLLIERSTKTLGLS